MNIQRHLPTRFVLAAVAAMVLFGGGAATADSPAVERTMECTDPAGGNVQFVGEQVRNGATPHVWRNVDPTATPKAFVFHGVAMSSPDGTIEIVEAVNGATDGPNTVQCGFIIPVGPNTGKTVLFSGFFVP